MGTRGPVPKRSDQRRRRNEPEGGIVSAPGAEMVEIPEPDANWHPVALMIWESLPASGQSRFYEPSDWAAAFLMCESISRDLREQVVGIVAQGPNAGDVVKATIPLKGASLSAYRSVMATLGVTEGDRRRIGLELQRHAAGEKPADPQGEHDATVTRLRSIAGNG